MTRIEDLFTAQEYRRAPEAAAWDPFAQDDVLHDTQLLDARVCPTANRAALLFDMRTASYFPTGNAALVVVRGLQAFHWTGAAQSLPLMAFSVMSSRMSAVSGGGLRMDLEFFPDGEFSVSGERADFYLLEVRGISEAPPNYVDSRLDEVRHALPWWDGDCTVLQSTSTNTG
ncbi:hypothetical protein GT045_05625 [Streptomyces sp. SID486]|uniref:hypothetical protein n=1 Tax=unclassified Streptomyces TaxID=2593676 RepID=UPI001369564F|nr:MULTISPECIES: hypothetical protein [unclassified Streptomyces]MYW49425.1 hypothetical protein [Streptomyces sp. SID161]MYX94297.1 hypothetical protein [Streptomyces sp. SID486]